MPFTFHAKTGVVGIARFVESACATYERYSVKAVNYINALEAASFITPTEQATALAFLVSLAAACVVFKKIADLYREHAI